MRRPAATRRGFQPSCEVRGKKPAGGISTLASRVRVGSSSTVLPVAVLVLQPDVESLLCRSCSCYLEICVSSFCLELSFFFCASCAVFAPLRLRASSVRFAVPQCSQRPNSLNASSRLVLDCRDSLAVCSAESDRVLRNPMRRMIVLAAGSRR